MKTKKTICIVSPFPPPLGGMAIQARKMVRLLIDSGVDVIAVKTNADIPDELSFAAKIKGMRTLLTTFFFLLNLESALRRSDVVYFLTGFFNFFFWVTYPALVLIKLRKKRVILSVRGGGAREFFKKYKSLLKPILRKVDVVTAPSAFLRDVFLEFFGIEPVVVPNIADLEQFRYRQRIDLKPNILVTRSLEDIYNVECVVRAFEIVSQRYPEARLGIVGDGTLRKEIEALVRVLKLEDLVQFYGRVEHSRIQEIYDRYDIFVNASRVDNLPGTILESFACGLPVVTTSPGGIPYLVKDGETGILVKTDDYQALAREKTMSLLKSPEMAGKLTRKARDEVRAFSWDHVRLVLFDLF